MRGSKNTIIRARRATVTWSVIGGLRIIVAHTGDIRNGRGRKLRLVPEEHRQGTHFVGEDMMFEADSHVGYWLEQHMDQESGEMKIGRNQSTVLSVPGGHCKSGYRSLVAVDSQG